MMGNAPELKQRVAEIEQQTRDVADYLCSRGDTMPMRAQIEGQVRRAIHGLNQRGWRVVRADLAPAPSWQPIETAPKDGTQFLASDGASIAVGCFYDAEAWDRSWGFRVSHFAVSQHYDWKPTHWMPLPAPPEAS